jgi:hypothetical protein
MNDKRGMMNLGMLACFGSSFIIPRSSFLYLPESAGGESFSGAVRGLPASNSLMSALGIARAGSPASVTATGDHWVGAKGKPTLP